MDDLRDCIYCGVECVDADTTHAPDCPRTTRVYPVREQDFGPECVHCGERGPGFACLDCGAAFALGDHYYLRDVYGGFEEAVCIGCAASSALT